jgi:hypothetical protein
LQAEYLQVLEERGQAERQTTEQEDQLLQQLQPDHANSSGIGA